MYQPNGNSTKLVPAYFLYLLLARYLGMKIRHIVKIVITVTKFCVGIRLTRWLNTEKSVMTVCLDRMPNLYKDAISQAISRFL
jgi:hypothetical protein